ncbi:gas vesicle protein [Pullulanibacillus pueri]|uniref:YtxH domain-containing protein n=1 Tax=Pullulanibacillus pueri TaxID=1437324 RepID=A0A8J3ELA0_9BACL|nr:YtxH domain-containing protein [Pullulanibacillus pueri]MBM7680739.1 gas vesicle protein [Pullulanibacillus pueri]GGH78154.1 hypothetical protein GCM10007096_11130 [Pullulanibacillus pueri]
METTYHKSKLGKFMLVGGLVGAAISLFDRGTRAKIAKGLGSTTTGGVKLFQTMKSDPSSVTNYIKQKADSIKMAAQDISQDLNEMADKMNGVTTSSKQAYQYAMEAGSEISAIANKLKHPMQQANTLSGTTSSSLPSQTGNDSTTTTSYNKSSSTSQSGTSARPSSLTSYTAKQTTTNQTTSQEHTSSQSQSMSDTSTTSSQKKDEPSFYDAQTTTSFASKGLDDLEDEY